MPASPATPRPAATVILARDTADGMQVLLLRRSDDAKFVPGAYVFPGGTLDDRDASPELFAYCGPFDDAAASQRLGVQSLGLSFWIAAIRECFEEAGVLFATSGGAEVANAGLLEACRHRLLSGELDFAQLCALHDFRLAADRLAYFDHWITSPDRPRRFDTRFFVAAAPARQCASQDGREVVDSLWIRPGEALERQRAGDLTLVLATIRNLQALAQFRHTDELMTHARSLKQVPTMRPLLARAEDGGRFLLPDDHAYAEVAKLDPQGTGTVSCQLLPGRVTRTSAGVRRITAPNPNFMTGPGTNTYLLGEGDQIAVLDPGPPNPQHVEAILAAVDGRIRWILATHTHHDHSPAAAMLKARTGATVIGGLAPSGQDASFRPDRVPAHGERLRLGEVELRVLHTPGHASNHFCYLLEEKRLLFTGDHIMQGSTVVINPPDGDMRSYLASLRLLLDERIDHLAPGHGFLIDQPHRAVRQLIEHRLARENKVLTALRRLGTGSEDDLLAAVYDDVRQHLLRPAARSLLAHLMKLEAEGLVTRAEGAWQSSR